MKNLFALSASTAIFTGLLIITGCSSSSDDGSGGVATVPANATIIDETNAEQMVAAISQSLSSLDQAFAVGTTPVMGLDAALDIIKPYYKNHSSNSAGDIATGIEDSGSCDDGGTYSDNYTETIDGENYSVTGTVSFVNCSIVFNPETTFIINGSVSYAESENGSTGDYTDSSTGSLSISVVTSTDNLKISFTGLNFAETGNNFNSTYTTTKSTFALVVVVNGTQQVAFLTELKAPVVESDGDSCAESGHIFITGGNGTTAEGIYNGDGTMTIKANGALVRDDAPCY